MTPAKTAPLKISSSSHSLTTPWLSAQVLRGWLGEQPVFPRTPCQGLQLPCRSLWTWPGSRAGGTRWALESHWCEFRSPTSPCMWDFTEGTTRVSLQELVFLFLGFHIGEITQHLSFSDSVTGHNALKLHPCGRKWQDVLLSRGWG